MCAESCGNKAANERTPVLLIKKIIYFWASFGAFWHLGFLVMKCFKVSLRLLNSSTKLLHNISLPLNICSVWFEMSVLWFPFPFTLLVRLYSLVSSLNEYKVCFCPYIFLLIFFFTRCSFKNWNIRHLDLLKSQCWVRRAFYFKSTSG